MRYILCLFIFFIGLSVNAQGPWVYEKGHAYSHIAASTLSNYDKVFMGNFNNLVDIGGNITEVSLQSYTEYGLGKGIGLTLSVPLVYLNSNYSDVPLSGRLEGNLIGLGNVELGLKYKLLEKSVVLTTMLVMSLPVGSSDELTGLQTAYDAYGFTPIVSIGKGYNKWYWYSYAGIEVNTNDYNNNVRFGMEAGRKFFGKLWTIFSFNMEEVLMKKEKTFNDSFMETRLFINDQYYNSFALKLSYELSDSMGINASANLISVRANNLPFKSPLSLGFYKKW